MIRVTVELLSAVSGETKEIARMHICNDASGTETTGNYYGYTFRGRDKKMLDRGIKQHQGKVLNHKRLSLHVWHLVSKMLNNMGYE